MSPYLSSPTKPLHLDPRNIFTVCFDLNHSLFAHAYFAIIPERGALYIHFMKHNEEGGQPYHDVIFDASSLGIQRLCTVCVGCLEYCKGVGFGSL
jgi:hypothetical protein